MHPQQDRSTGTMTESANTQASADILIIDDDLFMRELLQLHLMNEGYKVRVAEDAVEGGKMLMAAPPDLLLLDIRMPHMGGDEFLSLLRGEAQFKDLKVIALSSIQNSGLMMKVTDIGVCDFLHKPVNKEALIAAVKKALGR